MALLGVVSALVKVSARMRMNYNFHKSLEDRFLDAVEPGTVVPIHRHVAKDECFVVLRGKVRVTTVIGDVVLSRESGCYGVDIPKNVWHMVEALEAGSVVFEGEEGGVSMRWKAFLKCLRDEEGVENSMAVLSK